MMCFDNGKFGHWRMYLGSKTKGDIGAIFRHGYCSHFARLCVAKSMICRHGAHPSTSTASVITWPRNTKTAPIQTDFLTIAVIVQTERQGCQAVGCVNKGLPGEGSFNILSIKAHTCAQQQAYIQKLFKLSSLLRSLSLGNVV